MAETGQPGMELLPHDITISLNPAECISDPSSSEMKVLHQPEEPLKSSSEISCSPKERTDSISTAEQSCNTTCDRVTDQQQDRVVKTQMSDGMDIISHHNKQTYGGSLTVRTDHVLYPHKDLKENSLLSIQRSHSDSLQIFKDGPVPSHHFETGAVCCPIKERGTCAQSFPSLVCKQAMPLQQSNTVTTSTRTGSSGSGSPTQPAQQAYVQTGPSAQIKITSEAIPESTCPEFHKAVCCNLHFHHGGVEDTFAAYCHPQPIPAPVQLLPHSGGMEENYQGQVAGGNLLALPRLITSVSETGLDVKRLFHCCDLDCSWPLRPAGTHLQQWKDEETTREAGTMTSQKELREIGVQVGHDSGEQPQHVFPEVCLVEEKMNGSGKSASKSQKSPVREVKWDAEGMTWEVYGASVDPEELGIAIQRHLELQIKETKGIAAKLSRQNTTTSQHSSGSTHRKNRGLLKSLRRPGCCSTTAID